MTAIEDLILHRPPALCIDEIVECGESEATCALTVRAGPLAQGGHLWEPALLEAVAQTAAVMGGLRVQRLGVAIERGWLVGVRDFVIRRAPRVGERITCHVRSVRRLDGFVLVDGRVTCGDELLAGGQLKFHEVVAP